MRRCCLERAPAWTAAAASLALVLCSGCGPGGRPVDGDENLEGTAGKSEPRLITALGRIEPKDGIIRVAGPSRASVVIAKLLVEEGDRVNAGQPIAVLDTQPENEARAARARAELTNAERELARIEPLVRQGMAAASARDDAQLKVDVARAEVTAAESALELDTVRAPASGQVIAVHARRGERVGPEGIAEVAQTDQMYAVAEVYETDIGLTKVGQRATVRSPALVPELTGTVERIGMKVRKLDVLDSDPVARTDARVVEVRIKLDDSARSARLSNLQVDVAIEP